MRILSLSLVAILAAFMLTIAGFQLNASGNFSAGVNSLFKQIGCRQNQLDCI